jgi:hypothetical protein
MGINKNSKKKKKKNNKGNNNQPLPQANTVKTAASYDKGGVIQYD